MDEAKGISSTRTKIIEVSSPRFVVPEPGLKGVGNGNNKPDLY